MPSAIFTAPAHALDDFGVYIHIPFCAHICAYCDFNTYAGQDFRVPAYVEAVCREIGLWSAPFTGRSAASIYLGGGTPSLLSGEQIGRILATCRSTFTVTADAEVTLEANPNDLDEVYCAALREAGVNRLSIGVQTLSHRGLRVLGRLHDSAQIATALAAARSAGFRNVSLDLISGWPGQTVEQCRTELERILAGEIGSAPDHLSIYGLIVEPGTPMADAVERGILAPADEDLAAELYDVSRAALEAAGWTHYEIANWCRAPALASRHNGVYWRNGEYAGIGAGAHGYVGGRRLMNQPSPQRYIAALASGRSPTSNVETIGPETAMGETMMLGLRLLHDGVAASAFRARHGVALEEKYGAQLARFSSLGLIDVDAGGVRLTSRGALLANTVCAEFL